MTKIIALPTCRECGNPSGHYTHGGPHGRKGDPRPYCSSCQARQQGIQRRHKRATDPEWANHQRRYQRRYHRQRLWSRWFDLGRRQRFDCGICRKPLRLAENWHIDHIIPRSHPNCYPGDIDHPDNTHLVHATCNQHKAAKCPAH